MRTRVTVLIVGLLTLWGHFTSADNYEKIIRNGNVFSGLNRPPERADVAVQGDRIAAIGDLSAHRADVEIDASGLAVTPGFINMLSWAGETLLIDPRGLSDVYQGVTLEVFGEGRSMGPLNPRMQHDLAASADGKFDVTWSSLGGYLDHLQTRGLGVNVASFVGATTVRVHELGYADRQPTQPELNNMKWLVRQAMLDGAMGLSSSLIYAPGFYAGTRELTALATVAANSKGLYVSHLRSEGDRLLEALDEFLEIVEKSNARGEIYHFKVSGRNNWPKLDTAITRINAARYSGLTVGANMYTYTAASTGLDAAMPPWVQEGGYSAWAARLQDPQIRARVAREMRAPNAGWENLMLAAGADKTLLVGFRNPSLRHLTGKTLAQVARDRGQTSEETAIDLVLEDGSQVQVVYFLMSEANVRRIVRLPWVTFGSDAAALAAEGVFVETSTHPRAYGNFARLLGRYVREHALLPLHEAVHRLTALPAQRLKLHRRGLLKSGYYADIAIFDPQTIADRATFEAPHRYATGMRYVMVNGAWVLHEGKPTGALPGVVLRGPGWRGWRVLP